MLSVFIFILGSFFGSFLNLLVDRLPKGENVISGRSHCDSCGKPLAFYDLIPIISYLYLRGKCRYCNTSFSYFYPFMEIFTGLIFTFNYFWIVNHISIIGIEFFLMLFYFIAISSSLIVIFFADLRHGIIPNQVLIFLLIFSIIYQFFFMRPDFVNHLISGLICFSLFLILVIITKGRGMGFGDVKFSFLLGFLLGFPSFVLALYAAFLTGAVASIILILWGKKRLHKDTIAFGPFMALGVFIALFFGDIIVPKLLPFLTP